MQGARRDKEREYVKSDDEVGEGSASESGSDGEMELDNKEQNGSVYSYTFNYALNYSIMVNAS